MRKDFHMSVPHQHLSGGRSILELLAPTQHAPRLDSPLHSLEGHGYRQPCYHRIHEILDRHDICKPSICKEFLSTSIVDAEMMKSTLKDAAEPFRLDTGGYLIQPNFLQYVVAAR
jgi:hypothetical protein